VCPQFHRRDQILYNRLCIGPIRLTHSYLIDHTDPPECTNCHQLLSVKHILTECNSYHRTRQQYLYIRSEPLKNVTFYFLTVTLANLNRFL